MRRRSKTRDERASQDAPNTGLFYQLLRAGSINPIHIEEIRMASLNDIKNVVQDLHDKKILNQEVTLKDLLALQSNHITNPGSTVGWYIAGGDHYVLIVAQNPTSIVSDTKKLN